MTLPLRSRAARLAAVVGLALVIFTIAAGPASAQARADREAITASSASDATTRGSGAVLPDPYPCPGCYRPALRTSWQWQLQYTVDTSFDVDMYDIDGFDASAALVQELHDAGASVVCYISAGSWERWRPDADGFPAKVLGKSNGWPGEKWLDIRRIGILGPIMKARLHRCDRKGFDAVEFDNVDGYQNDTGFRLSGADQLRYNVFLANHAHRLGMSAVLKNDVGQIRTLIDYFDFALNEQCHQYHECDRLDRFVDDGKAVFGVEYKLKKPAFCPQSNAHDFNFLKKRLGLGPWRRPCRPD
jgi:hypothetical protein